jgi:anti-anti-sigma regulatory factor
MPPGRSTFSCVVKGDAIAINGAIDETAQLVDLLGSSPPAARLVLDLSGVTFINSVGVREWVRLQTAARSRQIELELRGVAEVLVHQLNIVPAARAASRVISFYATYICDDCEDEQPMLIDVTKHHELLTRMQAPDVVCQPCQKKMTLINAPELYFSFLSGTSVLR